MSIFWQNIQYWITNVYLTYPSIILNRYALYHEAQKSSPWWMDRALLIWTLKLNEISVVDPLNHIIRIQITLIKRTFISFGRQYKPRDSLSTMYIQRSGESHRLMAHFRGNIQEYLNSRNIIRRENFIKPRNTYSFGPKVTVYKVTKLIVFLF